MDELTFKSIYLIFFIICSKMRFTFWYQNRNEYIIEMYTYLLRCAQFQSHSVCRIVFYIIAYYRKTHRLRLNYEIKYDP